MPIKADDGLMYFLLANMKKVVFLIFLQFAIAIPIRCLGQTVSIHFIDRVEVFVGGNITYPNSRDWAEFTFNSTDGQTVYSSKAKTGYLIGGGVSHSMSKHFEIQGRFSFEKRTYDESYQTFDGSGDPYGLSETNQGNNYLTLTITPAFYLLKIKGLYIFSGISYYYLTKSLAYGETYINGQFIGSAFINTIDGFEKHIIDAVVGVGYYFPLSKQFNALIRVQSNYGLTSTISENNYTINVNSLSAALSIQFNYD